MECVLLIRLAIRLIVASAALGVLFYFVPARTVAESLTGLQPAFLAAGVLLQYVMRAVATVRMKVITTHQGVHLAHRDLFRILLVSHFYSTLLPGPLVGGGATWVKYVQHGADRQGAAVAILLNRGVATLVMATLGAAALFADLKPAQTWTTAAAVVAGLVLLTLAHMRWLEWRPPPESLERTRLRRLSHELLERALLFGRMPVGDKAVVLFSSVVFELVGAGVMWCFARAAGLDISLLTVLWMRAALQLVLALPLSIGGLGIREAGLVGLCALVGIPAADAVTWSLTIFFGSLIIAATGAVLESGTLANLDQRSTRPNPAEAGAQPGPK